jgi:predicted MFS family arabinose efflux permease
LYFVVFSWLSITCGRFVAPFLEHEAGLTDTWIGLALALQVGLTSIFGTWGSSWADGLERRHPQQGRAYLMLTGVVLGTSAFSLHGIWRLCRSIAFFQSTLWHVFLRVLYACFISIVMPVLDGLTLAHLDTEVGKTRSDYGKERLYGAIGWGLTNLVMGPFMDWLGYPAMYAFSFLFMVLAIILTQIYVNGNLVKRSDANRVVEKGAFLVNHQDKPQENDTNNQNGQDRNYLPIWVLLRITLGTLASVTFFGSYFCLSSGFAVVENMVFLFFEFLGGSNTLNGITTALTVMFEVPIFHLAPSLLHTFGPALLLQAANLAYIVRVVGYTVVPQVWWVLAIEPLHGVIYGCSQTAGVEFVSDLVPLGYEASGQGLLFLFRGLGGIGGLALGGYLEQHVGPRTMYRMFASVVATGATMLLVTELTCGTRAERRHLSEQGELEPLSPRSRRIKEEERERNNEQHDERFSTGGEQTPYGAIL